MGRDRDSTHASDRRYLDKNRPGDFVRSPPGASGEEGTTRAGQALPRDGTWFLADLSQSPQSLQDPTLRNLN